MINIILVSQEKVIIKIFTLVCNKLNINLTVLDNNYIKQESDLIIVDDQFIDDHFNLIKQYSKQLGAITSQDLPFEKAQDFIIPRPFLPSILESILLEQIQIIEKNDEKEKQYQVSHQNPVYVDINKQTDPAVSYLEDLADSIVDDIDDIQETHDESIIHYSTPTEDLTNGNVLDSQELSKLQNMLEVNDDFFKKINISSPEELSKEDWVDLADIIDKAIDDVKEYEFDDNLNNQEAQTIQLTLNKFALSELRPLLQKLDQSIIDNLADGNDIHLHLTLKD
ncbi:MAG: hypothetical protein U9N30_05470 [Campylobacterota bacterium]|nr:hypothetical protein [Campylobacterota bacterium]